MITARLFDAIMYPLEASGLAAVRRRLARRVSGSLLEIGPGTGANLIPLQRYASGLADYTGIDPGPPDVLYERARQLSTRRGIAAGITRAPAEDMPFAAASFDTVLVTLVLCSVDSQRKALSEMRRVLKPGGRLLFLEHVRHPHAGKAVLMDAINPVYNRITRECNINRDTLAGLNEAGFRCSSLTRSRSGIFVWGEAFFTS